MTLTVCEAPERRRFDRKQVLPIGPYLRVWMLRRAEQTVADSWRPAGKVTG